MPKAKFFFVNKDSSSDCLTHSTGSQRSDIQKHVQRGLNQHALLPPKAAKFDQETTYLDDKALYNDSIRSLACKMDPFNTASVHIEVTVRALIDYYISYFQPTIWTYDLRASLTQPYAFADSVAGNVRLALQDRLTMYCLLSAASARITNVDGLQFPGSPIKQDYFMHQALCLMQASIDNTDARATDATDRLANCTMFLCAAEAYRSRFDAAAVHLKAALTILQPKGGVEMVRDQNLQGQLLMSDLALSCVRLEPCSCPCVFYDPGPSTNLDLADCESQPAADRSHGRTLLCRKTNVIPVKLKCLIYAILDTYSTKTGLQLSNMKPARAFETTHWVQKRNMAIRSRLLAFETSDDRVHVLRVALIMWTLLSMNITGRVMTVKVMAESLRSILIKLPPHAWNESGDDNDIRLWILLVGHSCARDGSSIQGWYSEQIRHVLFRHSDVLNGRTANDGLLQALITFQKGFLYHDPMQRQRTEELARWLIWWDHSSLPLV